MKNDFTCPVCQNSFHETTIKFDRNKALTGDMFKLKEEHRANAWDCFEEIESITGDNITCPGCGNCYADSFTGKVRTHD
jgi:uncharacterized protein (DUF2225 family)